MAISPEELERFSFATVADQTASYGRPLAGETVRAMMVSRANGMAKAGVGVRRELLLQLVEMLNRGVHPVVRELGSVGQADLSEMSDIGKVLIGRGRADVAGEVLGGEAALARVGLSPLELAPKEALALISANGVTVGQGSLVLADAADLADGFQIAARAVAGGLRRQPVAGPPGRDAAAAASRPDHRRRAACASCSRAATCGGRAPRATCRTRCPSAACRRPTAPSTTP